MVGHHQSGQHAVVIGAGMAGLLAARVLADHYAEITILERDALPRSADPRKGVPQGRHAHALLARGQQILEELFPGLTRELIEQGAARGYGRFFAGGGYLKPVRLGPGGLFVSRPCLETAVRARVLTLSKVQIRERWSARGLVTTGADSRVTGVRLSPREAGADETVISADLVLDATGRGSQAPYWIEALGYSKPEVEVVEVGMGYSSRLYRREPNHLGGDLVLNVAPTPSQLSACGMLAQEGDRWIVTLAGYFGAHPPTDEAGFLEFARRLPVPEVFNVIRTATPLSAPTSYRFPSNQRRHYERLAHFPAGFLVIGDAMCSFTPIYGQGMTVAALEAQALEECLAGGTNDLARRFFTRASRIVDTAWSITVSNDARLSGASGRGLVASVLDVYMDRLHIAARTDSEVAAAFLRVANMLDSPSALLHPRVALRVLRGRLRRLTADRKESRVRASVPHPG